jgi:integrase
MSVSALVCTDVRTPLHARARNAGRPRFPRNAGAAAGRRRMPAAGPKEVLWPPAAETVALDLDDVRITTRKGVLVVMGKGEMRHEVPLTALVRQVLDEWLEHRANGRRRWRAGVVGQPEPAIGLSARSADRDVRMVAAGAGLELSAHTLRHTCLTGLGASRERSGDGR